MFRADAFEAFILGLPDELLARDDFNPATGNFLVFGLACSSSFPPLWRCRARAADPRPKNFTPGNLSPI